MSATTTVSAPGEGEPNRPRRPRFRFICAGEFMSMYKEDKPEIIHGFLREQEIMNVIGAPKTGKSWFALQLAVSVVTGGEWLGRWKCAHGRVLYVDNELQDETLACRIREVSAAIKGAQTSVSLNLVVLPVRGELVDIRCLDDVLEGSVKPGEYTVMVLDAWYRFMPEDVDENSNAGVTRLYSHLQQLAKKYQMAIVIVHHTSKGSQRSRKLTDRGAGAGSQSRSADTHLTIEAHDDADLFTVEAVMRSMKSPEPFVLRRVHPLVELAGGVAPLPPEGKPKKNRVTMSPEQFARQFASNPNGTRRDDIIRAARQAGMTVRDAGAMLKEALESGWLRLEKSNPRLPHMYYPADPNNASH